MTAYWIIVLIGVVLFFFYKQVGLGFIIMGLLLWVLAKRRTSKITVLEKGCPQCGKANRVEAAVCGSCGVTFIETEKGRACDLCGKVYQNFYPNEEGKYYCHKCAKTMEAVAGKK